VFRIRKAEIVPLLDDLKQKVEHRLKEVGDMLVNGSCLAQRIA
jgi:hypothetical protein